MLEYSEVSENQFGPLEDNSENFHPKKNSFPAHSETGISFFERHGKVRIANQLELRRKAYELLHRLYYKMGIASDEPNSMWLSIHDALPETTTFLAQNDQSEIDGALTVVFDSPIGLPADALYKEEIDRLRSSGRRVCEIISLGINDTAKGSVKLLAGLFYCAYLLSWRLKNSTDFVITVHARYEKFYCRYLLFKKIGTVRNYAKVNGAPTVLLNLPLLLPDVEKEKRRIFPLSLLNYSDQKELEVIQKLEAMLIPLSEEEFHYFFMEKTDVWKNAIPEQKDYLKKIYTSPSSLLH